MGAPLGGDSGYDVGVLLFGLTGGIASGKSVVAARFRERGVPVIDADQLAREVVAPGSAGLEAIVAAFGEGVLARGATPPTLDRKALAARVFADAAARRALDAITHPRIAALGAERARELASRGEPLACYEAALLVENGLADAFRPLVVVAASPATQLARALARDREPEEVVRGRLAAQAPLEDKLAAADVVLANDGTLEELLAAADGALASLCALAGVSRARYGLSE